MRQLKNFIFLFLATLMFTSCEDVVQVKLDEGSKLYVIDAFVNDLPGSQEVKVHYSAAYFSNSVPEPVTGANVVLKDLTAGKDYPFADAGNGSHVYLLEPGDSLGAIGHQYELNVSIAGFTYKSLATKKRTAVIRRIETTFVDGQGGGFGPPATGTYYQCSLVAKDTVDDNTDYYWIKTFRNDTLLFAPEDFGFSFSIDGTNGPVSGIGVDTTTFTPPVTFLGFKRFQPGDKCGVQIHSISRETYYFFVQAGQQVNNAGLFATTPENVRTNIMTPEGAPTKAVGWFNMATVTGKEIVIP